MPESSSDPITMACDMQTWREAFEGVLGLYHMALRENDELEADLEREGKIVAAALRWRSSPPDRIDTNASLLQAVDDYIKALETEEKKEGA